MDALPQNVNFYTKFYSKYELQNIKVTSTEMAQAVFASVTLNNPEVIVPNDILATQYHSDGGVWFFTMSTKAAKMHVLANNVITAKDKTFAVEDYSIVNCIRRKNLSD